MAILSKIRDRSGFLIIVIGLAMFSFVVSPKDIIDFFSNKNSDTIGEVNGEEIKYKDFASRVENAKSQSGRSSYPALTIENMVWNQMVSEKIYETKLEEAGVVVGEGEIWESITKSSQVTNSPQFKDGNGAFSEDKLKEYIVNLGEDKTAQGKASLQAWLNYEKAIKKNLLTQAYNNLINVGVNVSEAEAANTYVLNNTKVTADYVYVPFTSIKNAEVKVTEDEVAGYINNHKNLFQTEATRDLKVVNFSFKASQEDEEEIKANLADLIDDKEEYNKITNSTELVTGFRNTENAYLFADEVGTDLPSQTIFQKESSIPTVIKDEIVKGGVGTVAGPYKFSKYYKLTKVLNIQKVPDSVKAAHILISYAGAQSAQQNNTRTVQQAKKIADSILKVVGKSSKKFAELAKNYSTDSGSAVKGGDLGWFAYNAMVPEFRDYCFENTKGDIGVVKTTFGFHIIKIQNQKDFNKGYKLATISRKIESSEASDSKTFEEAEIFANALRNGEDFETLAKENNYIVSPVDGLKELDVYVGSLGENRTIVRWSFNEDTDVNTTKRFDLDGKGYAVIALVNKQAKGTKSAATAFSTVEPILIKEKKVALLKDKMEGASLEDIANANNVKVASFNNVSLSAPTIPGVGIEPAVVSVASVATPNNIINNIVGNKGVFTIVSKSVTKPDVKDVDTNVKKASTQLKSKVSRQLFAALKKDVVIKDYRASRY